MNKNKIFKTRNLNAKKLDYSSRSHRGYFKYVPNNSISHELGKFIVNFLISKGVDSIQLEDIINELEYFKPLVSELNLKADEYGQKFNHTWEIPEVIVEADIPKKGTWDIYILDSDKRVEVVKSNEEAKEPYDKDTVVVRI